MAQRNAFGDCWRRAVADARTCGKPPAPAHEGGQCGQTCADPVHCLQKGTRFHDLRHSYASTLIAANLNPKVIQARLGHATITETMDTYGNSQELHQTGENLQVAWSSRGRDSRWPVTCDAA